MWYNFALSVLKKPLRNVSKRLLVEIVGVEPPFFRVHLDLLTT